ncbi:uncharacterized protein L3040_002196 [Drepanopeziza brunnea f. sp. 'multigermtubi']|uniref:R3H-associated N-terminal domain-containing protein n=1 Tax=Marssonina brunnea f. sp. multigermtubi (strain MB_m1) TaxID=1072389 RepID=K1X4R2_MARBU|nr:uncharacterized protein MBM_02083 [Drepanopeziza brunnea f. sp. 'multigermtubi' MB_m1]EKD20131.1 hypothetical protein MBM_02083 [Drepanopeziza brunnea f. sp. 'multigermtubi' MB_m1]KAJ5050313.1 hypothetical protein L3040_002196 [Drepanopeziza brunnea f. sp. 'multigermtubi']
MAIYSSVAPPEQQAAPVALDVASWTATSALQALSISPSARGTGVSLSIPLEDEVETRPQSNGGEKKKKERRDSMKRREALLKGKEGSRRRQRWENDRLLHVPNAQPPLPSDWAPHATHRVNHIPYYLAPLWDAGIRHRAEEKSLQKAAAPAQRAGIVEEKGRVPSDLKTKLKKSKGAKTLLQELELEVRTFVKEFELQQRRQAAQKGAKGGEEMDSEDEEIVFIGRDKDGKGITMSDEVKDVMEEELQRKKIVYESLAGSPDGGFARWLVHSLAGYYGLSSWSETRGGSPAMRGVFVGMRSGNAVDGALADLPRPLWGMV